MLNTLRKRINYAHVTATLAVVLGLSGTAFATGATEALEGPESRTVGFNGVVPAIQGNSSKYVFAGPTAEVALGGGERLTGAASAPLGLTAENPQTADLGLCYQRRASRGIPASVIVNFAGANFSVHYFSSTRETYSASATVVLPPQLPGGDYSVGLCVRNNGNTAINNNNFVNGWVRVTTES
jgi:hypothetical protein